jgi:hypothetical protein
VSRRRAAVGAVALAVGAALLLGGCARAGGTPRQRISSWASSTGIVGLDQTVAADVSGIEGALQAGKNLTAKTVCDALYDDSSQAYLALPSPDTAITDLLNSADLSLINGANSCDLALGGTENKTLLDKALGQIRSGSRALQAADARLAAFGVKTTGATGATGTS